MHYKARVATGVFSDMLQCSGNSISEYRNDFVHLTYSFSLTAQMALNWLSHRLAVLRA